MPKMKTKSSAKKRFKVTGSGKIKRKHAFKNHILTKKSKKTTIMNYVKRNYGNFDTGQNPESYIGYKVFERTRQFVVYQRMDDGTGLIQEEMYLSNNKYDELLAEFFNKLEEDMAESESQN